MSVETPNYSNQSSQSSVTSSPLSSQTTTPIPGEHPPSTPLTPLTPITPITQTSPENLSMNYSQHLQSPDNASMSSSGRSDLIGQFGGQGHVSSNQSQAPPASPLTSVASPMTPLGVLQLYPAPQVAQLSPQVNLSPGSMPGTNNNQHVHSPNEQQPPQNASLIQESGQPAADPDSMHTPVSMEFQLALNMQELEQRAQGVAATLAAATQAAAAIQANTPQTILDMKNPPNQCAPPPGSAAIMDHSAGPHQPYPATPQSSQPQPIVDLPSGLPAHHPAGLPGPGMDVAIGNTSQIDSG